MAAALRCVSAMAAASTFSEKVDGVDSGALALPPTGDHTGASQPVAGDARHIVHQPVREIPSDAGVISIQTALP